MVANVVFEVLADVERYSKLKGNKKSSGLADQTESVAVSNASLGVTSTYA